MLTIANLFGKFLFASLQTSMHRIPFCREKAFSSFDGLIAQNIEKNDIRAHLPKNLFLPFDQGAFPDILSLKTALADQAEQIAKHASMKKFPFAEIIGRFTCVSRKLGNRIRTLLELK